jgi:hypothetical protein
LRCIGTIKPHVGRIVALSGARHALADLIANRLDGRAVIAMAGGNAVGAVPPC